MKKLLAFITVLLGLTSLKAQTAEYTYSYEFRDPNNFETGTFYRLGNKTVSGEQLLVALGKDGYELLNPSDMNQPNKKLVFRKQSRADVKIYEEKLNDFIAVVNKRIDSVAASKANLAAATMRLQILDGLKSAALLDSLYRKSIANAAVELFRTELKTSIEELKKEIKK